MIAYLKYKLMTDKRWLLRALQVICEQQTPEEKEQNITRDLNNVGFTGNDAEILTSICKWYNNKNFLTSKQIQICFNKMPKYAKQIFERIPSFDKNKLQKIMDNDTVWQKEIRNNPKQMNFKFGEFDLC